MVRARGDGNGDKVSWETEGSTVASKRIEEREQSCLPELPLPRAPQSWQQPLENSL